MAFGQIMNNLALGSSVSISLLRRLVTTVDFGDRVKSLQDTYEVIRSEVANIGNRIDYQVSKPVDGCIVCG